MAVLFLFSRISNLHLHDPVADTSEGWPGKQRKS